MQKTQGKNDALIDRWDKSIAVEESSYYWKSDPIIFRGAIRESSKPVVVEFFCGCGGTSMGFEQAGFEIALGVDIHRPSIETFHLNHERSSTILGDMKTISENHITDALSVGRVDVLIAGVPCQGFSLNNRKRTTDDKRNYLYREFVRLIRFLKPKCIVLENVSGMASTGNFREAIEKDLSLASGMPVRSRLLNALDYGVPQRRQRLIFIGVSDGFNFDTVIPTHGPGREHPFNNVRDAIGDLPSLKSGEEANRYLSKPISDYQKLMRKGVRIDQLTNHRAPKHPIETVKRIQKTKPGEPMYPDYKQRIRLSWDYPSPTQVSGGIRPQFQFGHPSDARGLSIRERCRIQSFPDTFLVSGGIVQGRVQTGNAVPPLLAQAIATALRSQI